MIVRASVLAALLCACAGVAAGETATSTYLGDAQRTAYVDAEVPAAPVLEWVYHEKHPPRHAWPEPNREVQYIDFDYATQTAIGEGTVFFGSSADHKVYAIDLQTGVEKWTLYTEGPVRFAPVVREGRVYAASDDGHLYCLKAATGEQVWKFRGGPGDRKLIGNEQMISHWPARSGVLIEGDRLYFTAGMWSRDGVFIYCLDPDDGSVIWKNDTSGYHFATLPHSTGYAGVAPQGYLALHRGRLYVPTGRGAPAAFDAATGEFQFYENGLGYKPHQPGGSRVMAWEDWAIFKRRSQHTEEGVRYEQRDPAQGAASGLFAIDFDTGKVAWSLTDKNIVAARNKSLILAGQGPVIKADIDALMAAYAKYWKDGKNLGHDKNIAASGVDYTRSGPGRLIPNPAWMSPLPYKKWQADVGRVFVLLCAGDTILAGGRGTVSAIDFQTGEVLWQKTIDGEARGICAVDGRFIVSSTAGKLYGFGAGKADSDRQIKHRFVKPTISAAAKQRAADILKTSNVRAGYALMLGGRRAVTLCTDRAERTCRLLPRTRCEEGSRRPEDAGRRWPAGRARGHPSRFVRRAAVQPLLCQPDCLGRTVGQSGYGAERGGPLSCAAPLRRRGMSDCQRRLNGPNTNLPGRRQRACRGSLGGIAWDRRATRQAAGRRPVDAPARQYRAHRLLRGHPRPPAAGYALVGRARAVADRLPTLAGTGAAVRQRSALRPGSA